MKHSLVDLDDAGAWDAALAGITHSHAHTRAHVAAFAASSSDGTFLYTCSDDDETTLVACPLSVRGEPGERDVYTPWGFSGFATARRLPEFAGEWQEFAAAQGWVASYIFQNPLLPVDLGFRSSAFGSSTACSVLDLSLSSDELLARMSTRRRSELRRWMREPAEVTSDAHEVLGFVLSTVDEFFTARNAPEVYYFAERTWSLLLGVPSVWSIAVRENGRVVSTCIFGESSGLVEYLFGFSLPGAAHTAPLIWEAIAHYGRQGASSLNLGGSVRPGDGVGEFKRRFGPREMPARRVRLVHRPDAYSALCDRAGTDPDPTGYFPPYRRRPA